MLQLKTIHTDTFELFCKLSAHKPLNAFALAGGTALALQLGHRISVDLDFLTVESFDSRNLLERLGAEFDVVSAATGTNSVALFINYKSTSIKIDLLRHNFPLLKPIRIEKEAKLYSLEDIAAMKLNAVANRGAKKDFYDVFSLLDRFSLNTMLDLFTKKYRQMNTLTVVKSLVYFDDAELEPNPVTLLGVAWGDVKLRMVQEIYDL